MKTGRCVRCLRANGAPLLGSRLMGKDSGGRWRLRTAKPPYRRRSRPECSDSNSGPPRGSCWGSGAHDPLVRLSQSALSALMLTEAIPPRVGRAKRTSASTRAPTTSYCLAVPSCPNRTPNLGLHGSSGRSSTSSQRPALASLWPAKASERSIDLLWERPDIRDRTDGPGSKRQRFLPRGS